MRHYDNPETVSLNKKGIKKAAMDDIKVDRNIPIKVRQVKCRNYIVEQGYRAVNRFVKPMLGFKSFH